MQRDTRAENTRYPSEPQRAVVEEDGRQPVDNERGIIAESYYDLQGLGRLASAREAYALPKASGESTLRACTGAAEIALLNLADVMARAATDFESGAIASAVGAARTVRLAAKVDF